MEPLEYLRTFRQRWRIIAGALLTAAAVTFATAPDPQAALASAEADAVFTATHTLAVGDTGEQSAFAVLVGSPEVTRRTAAALGIEASGGHVPQLVEIVSDEDRGTLAITATHPDGARAVAIADTYAEEAVRYSQQQRNARLESQSERLAVALVEQQQRLEQLEEELARLVPGSIEARITEADRGAVLTAYTSLQNRLAQLREQVITASIYSLDPAAAVSRAGTDGGPSVTRPGGRSRLFYALAAGLVLGLGLSLLVDRVDTRIHTRRRAEQAFGVPVVASIPTLRRSRWLTGARRGDRTGPDPELTDAYARLRVALLHMRRWALTPRPSGHTAGWTEPADAVAVDPPTTTRVILVTSATRGEGRTSVAVNLAASLAATGRQVAIADCDHHGPVLASRLPLRGPVSDGIRLGPTGWTIRETRIPHVDLVHVPEDVDPLERASTASSAIGAALDVVDVVVVDTGPLLTTVDATALVPDTDAVVVVIRAGSVNQEEAGEVRDLLANLGAPVTGLVFLRGRDGGMAVSAPAEPSDAAPAEDDPPPTTRRRRRLRATAPRDTRGATDGAEPRSRRGPRLGRRRERPRPDHPGEPRGEAPLTELVVGPPPSGFTSNGRPQAGAHRYGSPAPWPHGGGDGRRDR